MERKIVEERKAAVYRQGIVVAVVLAILTGFEFWVSIVTGGSAVLLFLIALAKSGLIVQYFMHIYRLWRPESH